MPEITTLTPEQILATPMPDNDADAATVRDYLTELLAAVWDEGEDFSPKRPFGNSGWQFDVVAALVKAGYVRGSFDEGGYLADSDDDQARSLVLAAIRHLGAAHA